MQIEVIFYTFPKEPLLTSPEGDGCRASRREIKARLETAKMAIDVYAFMFRNLFLNLQSIGVIQ